MKGDLKVLYEKAKDAMRNSYSPYSRHKVGAALRTSDGKICVGCNIENSSYGATVCAERVAIQTAVSENGKIEISELMVVTDASPPWPPCGICRQVIAEFGTAADIGPRIYLANLKGQLKALRFGEIFPKPFRSTNFRR